MERIPEEISSAFPQQRKVIGRRGLRFPDFMKILQIITSSLPTIEHIDALDESTEVDRVKLLDSLQQILERSPRTRVFIIGSLIFELRSKESFWASNQCISGSYQRRHHQIPSGELDEDVTPNAMDESLEADILERIPENMSEIYLGNNIGTRPHTIH